MKRMITLYRYECQKIWNKKIVWITFLLCVAAIALSLCMPFLGGYYVNGVLFDTNYNMYQTDKGYAAALNGRKIDQALLEEAIAAYRNIPEDTQSHYTLTEEYQQYARPYSSVFNFIHGTTAMQPSEVRLTWQPDEQDFYAQRQAWLRSLMESKGLTEQEITFWQEREAQIQKPFVYEEHGSWDMLLTIFQTVGFLVLLLIAICLSGIFYDEHTKKTDQIILCCALGKTKLYWAKIAAGVSFAAVSTGVIVAITVLITICLYGTNGFHAAFQLMYTRNSDPITCGQAIGIAYGNMLFAAVISSILVMVLSELLRSNIAALAISAGMLFLSMMFHVPEQYRVLAQIWDWLPWCFLAPWNVFNQYTVSLLGHYFAPWQAVPMIYLIASVLIALAGKPLYKQYQISGR